eukprot:NODE_475_length_8011_cov_0.074065.p1 type:complete len:801 gc:universal NODE_475_length_8011_cov_0.074065:5304-7706(+)
MNQSTFSFGGNRPTANTFSQQQPNTFGQQQQPAFGQPQQSSFGQSTFGNNPASSTFGSQPSTTFGNQQSGFGQPSASTFGQSNSTFGQQPQSGFGQQPSTNNFGRPPSTFGQQPTGFGTQPNASTFSTSNTFQSSAFRPQQQSGFQSGFNQSTPAPNSFNQTSSFRPSNTSFGAQPNQSSFNQFGSANLINNGTGAFQPANTNGEGYYQCITSDKQYDNFSLEELRLKDYQLNKKQANSGGFGTTFNNPTASSQPTSQFGNQSTSFGNQFNKAPTTGFGQTSSGFGTQPAANSGFGQQSNSLFGQSTGFGQSSSFGAKPANSAFGQTSNTGGFNSQPTSSFGNTSTGFGQSTTSGFGAKPATQTTQPSAFGSTQPSAFGTTQPSSFGTTQPAFGSTQPSTFGTTQPSTFGTTQPAFGSTQPSTFGSTQPSTFGGGFGSKPAQPQTSFNSTFQPAAQTTQPATFGNSTFNQSFGNQFTTPTPASNNQFSTPLKQQVTQSIQPTQAVQLQQTPTMIAKVDESPYGISPLRTPQKSVNSPIKSSRQSRLPASVKRQPLASSRYKSTVFSPQRRIIEPHSEEIQPEMFKHKQLTLTPESKRILQPETPSRQIISDAVHENSVRQSSVVANNANGKITQNVAHVGIPDNMIISPRIEDIAKQLSMDVIDNKISNLKITVNGVGQIQFMEPVDLLNPVSEDYMDEYSGLRLSELLTKIFTELIILDKKEVVVYPDEDYTPPYGNGLNVKIRVTMEEIWPIDRQSKKEIKDVEHEQFKKYKNKLMNLKTQKFINWDHGKWEYELEHL